MSFHESLLHHHAVHAERTLHAGRRGRHETESLGGLPARRRGTPPRAHLASLLVVLSRALAHAADRIEAPAHRARVEPRL